MSQQAPPALSVELKEVDDKIIKVSQVEIKIDDSQVDKPIQIIKADEELPPPAN